MSNMKTFVLRSKVATSSPFSPLNFGSENEVVLPMAVYEKLNTKDISPERRTNAIGLLNYIDSLTNGLMQNVYDLHSFDNGLVQKNGSNLFVLEHLKAISSKIKQLHNLKDYDMRIFQLCLDLQEQGKNPFEITKFDRTHTSKEIIDNYEKLEGKDVTVAGRIMAKRIMGKASFCHIQDGEGKIQSYVSINDLGEENYKHFKEDDIGDIIGITGFVFKTRTGEISIHAKEVTLLSKSLRPLPEKFHGLKDPDLRYRQRYVDLIMNPEVKMLSLKEH